MILPVKRRTPFSFSRREIMGSCFRERERAMERPIIQAWEKLFLGNVFASRPETGFMHIPQREPRSVDMSRMTSSASRLSRTVFQT